MARAMRTDNTTYNYHKRNPIRGKRGAILALLVIGLTLTAHAQAEFVAETVMDSVIKNARPAYLEKLVDTTQIMLEIRQLPDTVMQPISNINVRDLDVRNLLRGLGKEYGLNLIVDNSINKKATMRLSGIPVIEALIHICRENSLTLEQTGQVFHVNNYHKPKPKPRIPDISFSEDELMTLDLKGDDLEKVVRKLSRLSGKNIVIRNGIFGSLSGYLQNIPFKTGFETVLSNNGFVLREHDNIYIVDRSGMRSGSGKSGSGQNFWVNVDNGLISMDVINARITDLVREIGYQTEINLITYSLPEGMLTAKTRGLTLEETFAYLFRGTNVTYRREDSIYVIGDKRTSGIATNKLIRLKHIRADVVIEMLPESVTGGATVELIKEQNGLMVIGTNDIIMELEDFIKQIDHPTPQILIEALVVDAKSSNLFELGATLGYSTKPDSGFERGAFATFGTIDGAGQPTGGLVAQGTGETANTLFEIDGNLFGIKKLGVLPSDFYFRIQALSQEGVINVRSRPQISTLNGHKASIEIGTTQYFILQTTTPLTSPRDVVVQQSERFEKIEANVSLEITPWVSATGEVTTEIHPEFNTPVGNLNPEVPPTINSRVLDSTVRLKDGETIILGGLIQETENNSYNKVPILGDIPLLGKLFSNRRKDKVKSELVIFITPHVFYGNDRDASRWKELRDELDLNINN